MSEWNWDSRWPAPGKLNLFLHVVGRRPDGYHLLQTVFRFIDRCDYLRFTPRDNAEIILATPLPGVAPDTDLTVRAARLLQAHSGYQQGVTIHLDKTLPMGGGLGGGSSDAATTLLALNFLWQTGVDRKTLESIGLQLGADVPVFVHGQNCFAEGIGEQFTDLSLPPACYLVLHPAVNVPTASIFSDPELSRNTPALDARAWRPGSGHNDLEPVASKQFPSIATHLAWLREQTPDAMMTGSGACVFASFPTSDCAEKAFAAKPDTFSGWVCHGLAAHPLAGLP
ncbi:MAG: 4-(cytidine 5'-diphospho)-2-C-methyl-D-erythritol kinase [Azonexus sp.]|jgi:4-diphosphocytidyl-2-C-methyl-D-erythritol kinase|nr:4-(cytidine 5'-diphospho)-2-C-methyl-D-erythritol kinase [Azonexus sp.]